MKDAYSFDVTDEGLETSYQAQRAAYERIFTRLGLEYVIVKADAGAMGGSKSEEFLNPSPIGEDTFVRSKGGFAANVEAVRFEPLPAKDYSQLAAAEVLIPQRLRPLQPSLILQMPTTHQNPGSSVPLTP